MARQLAGLALAASVTVATVLVAACGSDGPTGTPQNSQPISSRAPVGAVACTAGKAVFSQSPIALGDFVGWVPLGNMGPPGHTFPTDHQYIYINNPDSRAARREVNIVAPSDIIITKAHQGTSTGSGTDYTVEFSPCAEVYAQFGHVLTIAPNILSRLGAFDQFCDVYSPTAGSSVSTCETKSVAIAVKAGDVIGTAGGDSPHSFALDFSLWDARVPAITFANPTRWPSSNDRFDAFHVVPASDYFAEPVGSQIAARVGSFDGKTQRTVAPIGGSTAVDVPGSAMGFWFNPSQPVNPEGPHLAISPDNVDPTQIALSIGTSLPGWGRGLVRFTPVNSGSVNRNPSQITADGSVYCFESPGAWVVLAKMIDASTLRLQSAAPTVMSCAATQPWSFTSAAFDYKR